MFYAFRIGILPWKLPIIFILAIMAGLLLLNLIIWGDVWLAVGLSLLLGGDYGKWLLETGMLKMDFKI